MSDTGTAWRGVWPASPAARVSRTFDFLVAAAIFIVLVAAYHIHVELTIGDWDFWVDWKDREFWPTFTPVLLITFPAAVQYVLWTYFRLPIGATLCCLGLLIGEWIVRVHGFHIWAWFPFTLIWPATMLPGAIALDLVLMLSGNFIMTGIFGGMLFALLFYPANWPMLAAYRLPLEHIGSLLTVGDMIGYVYPRSSMPEYLRIIERGTLRTFGGHSAVVSAFFSGFMCILMYFVWWYIGKLLATTAFIPSKFGKWMGLSAKTESPSSPTVGSSVVRPATAVLGFAVVLTSVLYSVPTQAHGERNQEPFLRMRTVHWYDVKFSGTKAAVNDEISITGKFRIFEDWPEILPKPDTVFLGLASPGGAMTRVESYIDGLPAIQSTGLQLGRDYDFKIVVKGRIPGLWHIHPMLNVHKAGPLPGPGEWIEVTGNFSDFRQPVTTLDGTQIPNLENWGLRTVFSWHALWVVLAIMWLLWWIRRPLLLPRYMALKAGRDDALITRQDRIVAVASLAGIIVLVSGGFLWAENQYPNTVPLQSGRVRVSPLPTPPQAVDLKVTKANYDVPGRAMRITIEVTNKYSKPLQLGEFTSANLRFIDRSVPAANAHVDPAYPKDLLPKSGLQVEPDAPLQPGETRTVKFVAADVAWEAERLTSLMRDPDSSFGGLLYFYDNDGERHIANVYGTIVPTFVH
jgi:methane/ammonia monooxygenase subunit B